MNSGLSRRNLTKADKDYRNEAVPWDGLIIHLPFIDNKLSMCGLSA
jgi:hypothetical protein